MNMYANSGAINIHGTSFSWAKPLLWIAFILFVIVAGYTIGHHEPWGDEVHSWNITKGSGSFFDLIHNIRFEGHPPLWYSIMWPISKLTHNYAYVQATHLMIASLTVLLILFYSPFPLVTKILIPFGYYFLYEYAVLSRNYAIGVLLAFCICIVIRKEMRYKVPLYYTLLFLLSNTHLMGLLLAGSLHLYFLLLNIEQKKNKRSILFHILLGALIFLPALYFIFPPSDSSLNTSFWINKWNSTQFILTAQMPLRSFIPIPAWWDPNSWNTIFLLEGHSRFPFLKLISPLLSLIIIGSLFWVLRGNKKSLILFGVNLLLTFLISITVFPVTWSRYAGFVFIGFIAAYWLYCYKTPQGGNKWIVYGLLTGQLIAAVLSVSIDIRQPFSNFNRVKELVNKAPANEKVVTDYWALNAMATFMDKPFYCMDLKKEVSFLLWDKDMASLLKEPYRYYDGAKYLTEQGVKNFRLVSTSSPESLSKLDPEFFKAFRVTLVTAIEGAIEKGGNLYLYEISSN